MPIFQPGLTEETTDPLVEVTVDPQRPLPPGRYVFQLVVVDDAGNTSDPDTVTIIVLDTQKPTAVIDGPDPRQVPVGQSFTLTGKGSSDPGGRIARYVWTRLS